MKGIYSLSLSIQSNLLHHFYPREDPVMIILYIHLFKYIYLSKQRVIQTATWETCSPNGIIFPIKTRTISW